MPPALPPDPALARAVRKLREQNGMTQEDLATRSGTTLGTISRLESARSAPAWATVRAVAKALGVSLARLGEAIEKAERTK